MFVLKYKFSILVFLCCSFLSIMVVSWGKIGIERYEKVSLKMARENLLVIARSNSIHLRNLIEDKIHDLQGIADHPKIIDSFIQKKMNLKAVSREFKAPYNSHLRAAVNAMYLVDANGVVFGRIPYLDRIGRDFSKKPGISYVIKHKNPYVSPVFQTLSKKSAVTICVPVFNEGEFLGVLRGLMYLEQFSEYLKHLNVLTQAYGFLLNDSGDILAHPIKKRVGLNSADIHKESSEYQVLLASMARGEEGVLTYSTPKDNEAGEHYSGNQIVAYAPVILGNQSWSIGIGTNYDQLLEPINDYRRDNIMITCLILVCVALWVIIYTGRLKETSRELLALKNSAEKANELKGNFIANMSHEIRTPMNAIIGTTELLQHTELSNEQHQYTKVIDRSSSILMDLISDILDFSKIEAGTLTLSSCEVNLREYMDSTICCLSASASKHNNDLNCLISDDVPDYLRGDLSKVRKVLINLIGNAIKFTENGQINVSVSCPGDIFKQNGTSAISRQEHPGCNILFTIEDTGIGIEDTDEELIFGAFIQGDGSRSRKHEGTGLGLAISLEIAKNMGGDIWMESEAGCGTTFYFAVPLQKVEVIPEPCELVAEPSAQAIKILVVDDDPMNLFVAEKILVMLGHIVTTCNSGPDAIRMVAENNYDLIFMDFMMPDMDGCETTRRIRKYEQETGASQLKIIALTACAGDYEKAAFLKSGMDDCLIKPAKEQMLMEMIAKHFNDTTAVTDEACNKSAS